MGSMLNIPSRMEGPEQKTIIGKPEITVSAKGIANGKSIYLNDGADFGPDTKLGATTLGQYGPPFTTTSGINESILFAKASYKIKWMSQSYEISSAINIPYNGVQIEGIGGNFQGGMANFSGFTPLNTLINVTSPNINAIEITTPGVYNVGLKNFAINFTQSPTGHGIYANPGADTVGIMGNTWENIYVSNVDNNHYAFYIVNAVYNTYIRLGGSGGSSGNGLALIEDDSSNNYGNSTFIECNFESQSTSTLSPLQLNATTHQLGINQLTFIRAQVTGEGNTYPLMQLTNVGVSSFYDSDIETVDTALGNNVYLANLSSCVDVNFYTIPVGYINLTNSTNNCNFYSLVYSYFKGDGTQSKISAIGGQINSASQGTISGMQFHNFVNVLVPTTPTVPASGTAQTNNNPYAVNVYIYGGTVTVIDYTPAGGTAIEVGTAGPATIRLNPGDAITLTYSAAPSWKWTTA